MSAIKLETTEQETTGNILEEMFIDNETGNYDEFEFKEQEDKMIKILLNQLTKLSSVYHQLPDYFVSSRTIMRGDISEGGLSPMEQSIKSLSLSIETTSKFNVTSDLPMAWTKLLRNNRPAVANLLDLSYENSTSAEEKKIIDSITTPPPTKQDKYANLLDLLD